MEKPTPEKPWRRLWVFDEDQMAAYQELRDELNGINAPVELRIVPGKLSKVCAEVRVVIVCL
jgi:hypothetical protein